MHAAKWLQVPVLCDLQEMESLLKELEPFHIFNVSGVSRKGKGEISKSDFLSSYQRYIECLQQGKVPDEKDFRHYFSSVFTVTTDAINVLPVGDEQELIRVRKPVLQLQSHRLEYSPHDEKFRSLVYGKDTLYWGILFSYPQLFEDSSTREVFKVTDSPEFPNTKLFKLLQQWIRQNTVPTPFIVEGQRINASARLGKKCFKWVQNHPQLSMKGLQVLDESSKY